MAGDSIGVQVARKLLQDATHHCSGSDTLLGSASVSASIFVLLLLGFVVGVALTWLVFWRREKRRTAIEMEFRERFGDQAKLNIPIADVAEWTKAARTPTIRNPPGGSKAAARAGTSEGSVNGEGDEAPDLQLPAHRGGAGFHAAPSGPLGLGVTESLKQDNMGLRAPAAGAAASSTFGADVAPFNRFVNPLSSLNNSLQSPGSNNSLPAAKYARRSELSASAGGGLIGAVFGGGAHAPDPASPGVGVGAAGAAAAREAAVDPAASDDAWGAASLRRLASGSLAGGAAAATGAAAVASPEPATSDASSGYAAALGRGPGADITNSQAINPCETGGGSPSAIAAQKAAQKLELLGQVKADSFDWDELDPEWTELLSELNKQLAAKGAAPLNSREVAVAIRSLIVSTASQSAEVALRGALADVETYRRMHPAGQPTAAATVV